LALARQLEKESHRMLYAPQRNQPVYSKDIPEKYRNGSHYVTFLIAGVRKIRFVYCNTILLILLSIKIMPSTEAGEILKYFQFYFGTGTGLNYSMRDRLNGNVSLSCVTSFKRVVVEYRYIRSKEWQVFSVNPREISQEHSAMIGYMLLDSWNLTLNLLGGYALSNGVIRGKKINANNNTDFISFGNTYDTTEYKIPGFAFEMHLLWNKWRYIGFGPTLFANLNKKNSYLGICATMFIGKLHPREGKRLTHADVARF
jgi:hypothetical protein